MKIRNMLVSHIALHCISTHFIRILCFLFPIVIWSGSPLQGNSVLSRLIASLSMNQLLPLSCHYSLLNYDYYQYSILNPSIEARSSCSCSCFCFPSMTGALGRSRNAHCLQYPKALPTQVPAHRPPTLPLYHYLNNIIRATSICICKRGQSQSRAFLLLIW